jgi:hypothetical protein
MAQEKRVSTWWTTNRNAIGVVLLGALGAGFFAQVWGFMTGISLPEALEPLRAEYPRTIVYWINVLYLGAIFLTLLPAAIFWILTSGELRVRNAVLACVPLVILLLADSLYGMLAFDFTPRFGLLLWDGAKIVLGTIALFVAFDVLRHLTRRWSGP